MIKSMFVVKHNANVSILDFGMLRQNPGEYTSNKFKMNGHIDYSNYIQSKALWQYKAQYLLSAVS